MPRPSQRSPAATAKNCWAFDVGSGGIGLRHDACAIADGRAGHTGSRFRRHDRIRARRRSAYRAERHATAPRAGLDLGRADADRQHHCLFIHQLRLWGEWSPIHLLAIYTLIMLPIAVLAAHRHDVRRHRRVMIGISVGALVIAGLFTFVPGRIMHAVAFGS